MGVEHSGVLLFAPAAAVAAWWLVFRARRGWLAPVSAGLSAGLIVVAIAGVFAGRPRGLRVFLIDVSGSVRGQTADSGPRALAAARRLPETDRVAIVAFGADARVVLPPTPIAQLPPSMPELAADERGTDLAAAVQLAAGLFPPGAAGDLVLVTDGRATAGDTPAAAAQLAAKGIRAHVLRLAPPAGRDAWIDALRAPASVASGQPAHLELVAGASGPLQGTLELEVDGRKFIGDQVVELPAGRTTFRFQVPARRLARPGLHVASAAVRCAGDTVPENNAASAAVRVSGKLDVTYVAAAEGRELATALAAADSLAVRRTAPADLSTADRALLATDVVVLDNVPADRLGGGRMAWLQSFVADAGGGLLVLGGPDAYGAGGYAGTPLAGLLPVDPDPERRAARPTSVAVVADRSSSMAEQVGGREKIEYVREAVLRARAEFGARSGDRADEMSVISFNERPEVLIERQRVGPPAGARALRAALVSLFPQGKTRIARALGAAQTLLARSDLRRHIVLVSDGRSQDELVARRLIAELRAKEVVLSVLGTADEMNAGLAELKAAAEGTQGRFVLLDSISELPAAMARETRTIAGSLVRLGEFAVDRGPGAWPGDVPAPETVRGYVLTGARPEAPPLLVAGQAPILAAWPRGLGRVVACTTSPDAWAPDWARAAPGFFEALVLWAGGRGRRPVVDVRLGQSDGKIRIVARAATDLGEAEPIAVVRRPGGERSDVPLRQTGRRRYEAEIDGAAEGTYVATVRGRDAGTPLGEGHLTVDVAEEWRPGGETGAGLRLARATGGVAVDDLSELPAPTRAGSATRSTRRFVSVLLGLAALAFLLAVLR